MLHSLWQCPSSLTIGVRVFVPRALIPHTVKPPFTDSAVYLSSFVTSYTNCCLSFETLVQLPHPWFSSLGTDGQRPKSVRALPCVLRSLAPVCVSHILPSPWHICGPFYRRYISCSIKGSCTSNNTTVVIVRLYSGCSRFQNIPLPRRIS